MIMIWCPANGNGEPSDELIEEKWKMVVSCDGRAICFEFQCPRHFHDLHYYDVILS